MNKENIYITGLGIHSCLGSDIPSFAKALHDGKCGLHHDSERKAKGYQSDLCGAVPSVPEDLITSLTRAQYQCFSRPTFYALSAVKQALHQACISDDFLSEHHVSLIVSNDSTAGEMMRTGTTMQQKNDTRYLGAGAVFRSLNSTVSMNLASLLGIHGLSLTVSAACAGGGHALGLGKMLLDTKQTEMVIVVGAQEDGVASMQSFDALGVFTDTKVQPFGKGRTGLAPSGGAACVILEPEHNFHLRAKKLQPWAILSGYGFSSNGTAISTPLAYQESVSMIKAMDDAGIDEGLIDVILAHATGTTMGDEAEATAIGDTFGMCPKVVATKGMTGHECWMAGVSQAVQAALILNKASLPGCVGTEKNAFPKLNLVMKTMNYQPHNILCNAFGFGGTNSSFIISKFDNNKL
ncbi:MAG TPA: beta-ketoacyl synthase [Prevotella sp.]|nr:beta-ketoacyl synthase [Candidatus Segatella violae]